MVKYSLGYNHQTNTATVRRNDRPGLALRLTGKDAVKGRAILLDTPLGLHQQALADLWSWAETTVPYTCSQ